MSAGRVYWGQILAVLCAFVASAVVATQWTADALGYQPQLGPPDALVWGVRLYAPWKFLLWWYHFDAYARETFETAGLIFLSGVALAVVWRSPSRCGGPARPGTPIPTAPRAGPMQPTSRLHLTSGDGVILGAWNRHILRHDGDEHVLVVAPTNTGKSVGVSLPTGLVWRHSYIALDLKGENWTVTSGLRASFGPVYRFAPTETGAHRYNPLTQIRRGDAEVRDAQILADMLVDPEGALRERSHWQLRAFELLVAVMLWTLYAERQKTLARVAELLADPQRPVSNLLEEMLGRSIKNGLPHPVVAAGARQLLDMAEAERSGVVSTALGYLVLYRDPVLARATEVSDFSIEDIITGACPVSLYLVIPPEEISRLKALLRLVLNQILKRLTEVAARQNGAGRRVLLMLDEFPQLGKLDFFEHALAYIRGYRIKACLVAQSLNQISQAYGEHSSILDNAHVRVAFACNDERTAKRISDMLGVTTESRSQMNYAGSRMAPWLGHTMVSRQEVPRSLLTPGEVMQLPATDSLILTGGSPPIRARKVRYFDTPAFASRVRPAVTFAPVRGPGVRTVWDGIALPVTPPAPAPAPKPAKSPARPTTRRAGASSQQKAFEFGAPVPPADTAVGQAPPTPDDRDDTHAIDAPDPVRLQFGLDEDLFTGTER
ncbi:MAG: IncP-type conjugal transfer protein TraG [Hyphomonadaceae bacterium]